MVATGWNAEAELLRVNGEFENLPVREVETIGSGLREFCEKHVHRQRAYVGR